MSTSSTSVDGMINAATAMAEAKTSAQRGVDAVNTAAAHLSGQWSGGARDIYLRLEGPVDRWGKYCTAVLKSLQEIEVEMVEQAHGIATTEATNEDLAQGGGSRSGTPVPGLL